MRNKIVHGEWEFRFWLEPPIHFDIRVPVKESGEYTLREFTNELEILNKVLENFGKLRNTYEIKEPTFKKTV
jgi:hypothetical protein